MRKMILVPLVLLALVGCREPKRDPVPAPAPAITYRPNPTRPNYYVPTVPPAPQPQRPPRPAQVMPSSPLPPPNQVIIPTSVDAVAGAWASKITRATEQGIAVRIEADSISSDTAGRVFWTTNGIDTRGSYFVGIDASGLVIVADYRSLGKGSGELDIFRYDAEKVKIWALRQNPW